MTLWLVRAGSHGEHEDDALAREVTAIGWGELGDLSAIGTREELAARYREVFADAGEGRIANHVGQLWGFLRGVSVGDYVVLPLKRQAAVVLGRVLGGYTYRTDLPLDMRHTHSVEWMAQPLPRSRFDSDILYSLGAFMTVCRITRNNAEERVLAMFRGDVSSHADASEIEAEASVLDVETVARDRVISRIEQQFKGHPLAGLVGAILSAQGYHVTVSSPGADGGVDVLAASGPIGVESPKICVQVKSGAPADVTVLRNLQGVMSALGADAGLLVSWNGFRGSVSQEAAKSHFSLRLWDQGDLVDALFRHYERLPEDIRTELPLRRIWALVETE